MDEFCGSKFWDWDKTWYTQSPDFTVCFEQTVLIWIPCGFLWVMGIFDILFSYTHKHSPSAIPWSALNISKLGVTLLLSLLDVLLLLRSRSVFPGLLGSPGETYSVDVYAPAIRVSTYILFASLLLYSKSKGVQSSGVHSVFWLILTLCEAIRFRTLLLQVYSQDPDTQQQLQTVPITTGLIYFPTVVGGLLLHFFADVPSAYIPTGSKHNPCPESSSSFFSQIFFHWFTILAWRGFRKPLEYTDLWDLNPQDKSKYIVSKFDKNYGQDMNKSFMPQKAQRLLRDSLKNSPSKSETIHPKFAHPSESKVAPKEQVHMLGALIKTFGPSYFFGTFLRLIPDLLTFVSPQILNMLIDFVEADAVDEPQWKGILYAVTLFLCAFTGTCILAQATHRFYLAGMRARTALVSAIYRKSLLLSNTAKRESTVGEIVNLMSVDVQRGTEFAQFANLLWSAPIQIGLALYFLWGILGASALAGLVVMVTILPLNAFIASKIRKLQMVQMQKKDERVKMMNEILSGIKVLKLYAWEPCFEKQVLAIRKVELKVMKDTAYLNALTNVLWQCAPFLVAISTFGTYVLINKENVLDAHKVFVSLSLFNIMSTPLTFLPLIIVNFVQAAVAFKRIDKYMNADEIDTEAVSHDETEVDPIIIENGTFCWEKDEITLRNINLRVKDGSLEAIVGVVGSGKSSLLSAMLGELEKSSGRVNTKGSVAYVSQQAWIQNATLRDNILFGKPFDPVRYDKVLEACALKPDLEILPAGDKTEIGEKGINLSGGQKQRVALARATYSNSDVYLFDDPLSAVDAHVGKHIFQKVLGPRGLLKRKTRVLVTHGVVYLPFMDNIYVLKGGEISESGTYKQLVHQKGAFSEFLSQHMTFDDVSELEETGVMTASDFQTAVGGSISGIQERKRRISESGASENELLTSSDFDSRRKLGSQEIFKGSTKSLRRRRPSELSNATSMAAGIDKLIEAEKSETEGVKASIYIDYFKAAGWLLSLGTFVLYLTFQTFAVGANLWLSEWSSEPKETFASTRDYFLAVYGGLGVAQVIAILGATMVMALGTVNSAAGLHHKMLRRILQAPMDFFDTTPIGRIVNRFAKDVDILDSVLPLFLRFWLNGIFSVLATLVIISYSTPIFIAVIIPITIVYYLIQKFYVASSRQLKRLESVTRSPIYSHFGETISGAPTIRAYRQQERFILDSESKVDHNQVSFYCSVVANRWLAVRLETVGNLVVLFAALFAVLGRESLGPGIVGLSVSYALQITLNLLMLVRFTSDVETNIVAVERLQEYSQAPQEAEWEIPNRKPKKSWPEMGQVTFQGYQTRYRAGLDLVLRNVTCTIQPGEKVGIVGRTGAGKSSLTLALFRIIEPTGGSITIDGQDICRLGLHDVRGRITIIPQDPVLFSGSLRLNLDPFDAYPDETIWHTLELAHLKSFVKTLPAGLSHEIAEGGENLSVGQRQLVCLARALLRKTKILVLDEATAAVDLDTDDLIQQTIRKEFADSTVITIAHRLNTILDSTRVIVLDKGEIKEFDSPQVLLDNSESLFSKMAKDAGL